MPAADATLDYALDHRTDALVGFGLGGPEVGVPRPQFQPHFDAARAAGLHSVPHAGETTGPETVWHALRLLGAERIGHGTSSAQDPALLAHLAETGDPARGVPVVQHRDPRGGPARGAPDPGVPRRRRDDHGELRRPADVQHDAQPRVRDRGRPARPRRGRRRRPGADRRTRVVRRGRREGADPGGDRRVRRGAEMNGPRELIPSGAESFVSPGGRGSAH